MVKNNPVATKPQPFACFDGKIQYTMNVFKIHFLIYIDAEG